MSLRYKAECMFNKINEAIDLAVKQGYGSLNSIAHMDNDTIEGLRSVNEMINEAQEYFIKQAEDMDGMGDQLDRLQKQMKELNSKMDLLLEKVNRKEKEQA